MKRNNPKVRPFPTAEPVDPLERGLPANVDCERYVLGAVLLNDSLYRHVAASLQPPDFSLEKHRRIFARMDDLAERGERIDPGTLANELMGAGELESCDGISYLVSLDDGMPRVSDPSDVDGWVRIVRTKATLRSGIFAARKLTNECLLGNAAPAEIIAAHVAQIQELSQRGGGAGQAIADIPSIRDCGKTAVEYLREPELPRGAVVAVTGDAGCGKSTLVSAFLAHNGAPPGGTQKVNMPQESVIPHSAMCTKCPIDRPSTHFGPLLFHPPSRSARTGTIDGERASAHADAHEVPY